MKNHELISITKAADLLGKDRATIARAMRGVEPDGTEMKQPRYLLATVMKAMEKPRNNGGGAASQEAGLTEARAELAREQAAGVALKNAVARGEYVPLEMVMRGVDVTRTTLRERILAIPGKIATSCEMRSRGEVEELLRAELYEALDELSRTVVDPSALSGGFDDSGTADEVEWTTEAAAEPQPD